MTDENRECLVQIKGNQGDIRDAAELCTSDAHERKPAAQTTKKRSRVDRRRLWLDLDNADYVREQLNFPGCQMLLRVDRDVINEDGTMHLCETRYFACSTATEEVTADDLLAMVRHHWQIENCVFFLKDRWWDEDRHWTRRPGLSEWLARLTTAATNVLRLFRTQHMPLRGFAVSIAWNPRLGLQILGFD